MTMMNVTKEVKEENIQSNPKFPKQFMHIEDRKQYFISDLRDFIHATNSRLYIYDIWFIRVVTLEIDMIF